MTALSYSALGWAVFTATFHRPSWQSFGPGTMYLAWFQVCSSLHISYNQPAIMWKWLPKVYMLNHVRSGRTVERQGLIIGHEKKASKGINISSSPLVPKIAVFLSILLFCVHECYACMYVCASYVCSDQDGQKSIICMQWPRWPEEDAVSSGTVVTDACELLCEWGGSNSGPWEEQRERS